MSSSHRLATLAAAALAAAVGAQEPGAPEQPQPPPGARLPGAEPAASASFRSYDADRDGKITRAEASADAALTGRFDGLDRNRDEALDTAEFAGFEAGASTETPSDSQTTGDSIPRYPIPPPKE